MPDELSAIAHHAAGRAVAAIVLGCSFTDALIRGDGTSQLEPPFQMPEQSGDELSPDERGLIEDEVVQLFAGAFAEERFTGRFLTEADGRL